MTALTWATLETTLLAIIARTPYPYSTPDGAFATLYPQATSYAENRIYREIPMLAEQAQDTSLVTVAGNRSIPLGDTALPVIVPERVALITPVGATPDNGERVQFIPVSLDFIDMAWPDATITQAPARANANYWALLNDHTAIIAPTPDNAYTVELTGLFQQAPISAGNQTTYLSTYYPELLTAACMVFLAGALLRNYGAQADEARMAQSWETQYELLKTAASAEELRRRQQGTNWIDAPPAPSPTAPGRP